jgi:hypothetical protein
MRTSFENEKTASLKLAALVLRYRTLYGQLNVSLNGIVLGTPLGEVATTLKVAPSALLQLVPSVLLTVKV